MKWDELLRLAGDTPVFTSAFLLAGSPSPGTLRRQLDRWVQTGRIVMLRRGVYAIREPYARRQPHPFVLANALRKASYVSLQSALSHHGMIPEHVPVVTSVTTKRPETLDTPMGRFIFRHVASRLFLGFAEIEVAPAQLARLAGPENALVDLLYLTPDSDDPAFLEELRLDWTVPFAPETFTAAARHCGSRKVERAAKRLLQMRAANNPDTTL